MKPRLLDLSGGRKTLINEEDFDRVRMLTLYLGQNGYAYYSTWVDGKSKPRTLHSFLVDAPKGAHIDHINGDKLDNRRENLRVVTPQRNQVNRKKLNRNNTSGIRGVAYRPNLSKSKPWHAQICVSRRVFHLGCFATVEEATAARRSAELLHYGELCP